MPKKSQDKWDKTRIYTLRGIILVDNIFQTADSKQYNFITYRIINSSYVEGTAVYANFRWSENLNEWVMFQWVEA